MLQPIPQQYESQYNFTGYRRPACYVMALVAIKTADRTDTSLNFRVDNILVAKWLGARLENQGYPSHVMHTDQGAWVQVGLTRS